MGYSPHNVLDWGVRYFVRNNGPNRASMLQVVEKAFREASAGFDAAQVAARLTKK